MNPTRRLLTAQLFALSAFAFGGAAMAARKAKHRDGKTLVGEKIKTHGKHVIDKKGPHTVSVEVKDGKVAGLHVKHNKKGELPVKKYKSSKKFARAEGMHYVGYQLAQAQSLGTVYIGFAYFDEYGDEEIYWFPYEMIYDGDTGAVEYVPVY